MARRHQNTTDKIGILVGGPSASSSISMFTMVKPKNFGANRAVHSVGHGSDSGGGYSIQILSTGIVNLDISFVANYNSALRTILNRWNRIALTRTAGGTWQFWLNGVKSPNTSTSNPFSPTGEYTLGANVNSGGTVVAAFQGEQAQSCFWDGAVLTDQQCSALTLGQVLPNRIAVSNITQYHPQRFFPTGTNEPFLVAGSVLTRVGTTNSVSPRKSFPQNFDTVAAAPSTGFSGLSMMGVGA